jgi:hypothetical protein
MGVRIPVTVVGVPDVSPSLRNSILEHHTLHDVLSAKSRNTLTPTEYTEGCHGMDGMDGMSENGCRFEEIRDDETATGIEEADNESASMRSVISEAGMSCAHSDAMSLGDMPE